MAATGVCCASLEEPKALMKMGLSMVLIGHVNFLLGALVHGVVLRHIDLHEQAKAMEYAIASVVALTSGLVGIVVGILAIVLAKNKKSRCLTWSLFTVSLAAALLAAASAIGLAVSVVWAIIHGGRSLLAHCRFPDAIGYSSVTNECPFDPTRIYINVVRPLEEAPLQPPRRNPQTQEPYSQPPRSNLEPPRLNTEPPRQLYRPPLPPQHLPRQHRSLPPSERQPLRQPPHRERSNRHRPETRIGSQQRAPEQHQLLERGTLERSSFWI
ncbi:transmembrane protein 54-like isoform X2 [Sphaeramia orbicularis]|uniref:transmembrane protein 54-like isoform X2 n=1 Tax=Sphaeramia orbicularis TaxID=375764 RepID=UPI00117D24C0|nr:transmembrane protein 54-like isoform X2 [Sphaeramia orbicularis]